MDKGQFAYTNRKYRIETDSLFKKFSIDGAKYEYQYYVIPDTEAYGAFTISAWLESTEKEPEETPEEELPERPDGEDLKGPDRDSQRSDGQEEGPHDLNGSGDRGKDKVHAEVTTT